MTKWIQEKVHRGSVPLCTVMCTIAGAKVQLNYNCHNVYFNECLLPNWETSKNGGQATFCQIPP